MSLPNRMVHFLTALCGGNPVTTACLLDWISDVVLRPEIELNKGLLLTGPPTCGKSLFIHLMRVLVGERGVIRYACDDILYSLTHALGAMDGVDHLASTIRLVAFDDLVVVRFPVETLRACMSRHAVLLSMIGPPPELGPDMEAHLLVVQCHIHTHCPDFASLLEVPNAASPLIEYLKTRRPWLRARRAVRLRAIVLYWLGLTEELSAPGGAAFLRSPSSRAGSRARSARPSTCR